MFRNFRDGQTAAVNPMGDADYQRDAIAAGLGHDDEDDNDCMETVSRDWDLARESTAHLAPGSVQVPSVLSLGLEQVLEPQTCVSLHDEDYFYISTIVRNRKCTDASEAVTLHGLRLRRSGAVDDQLEKKIGEVCMLICAATDDPRPDTTKGLESIPLALVLCTRQITFTNQTYPALRDPSIVGGLDHEYLWQTARLVCRRKRVELYERASGTIIKFVQRALIHLAEDECTAGAGKPREELLRRPPPVLIDFTNSRDDPLDLTADETPRKYRDRTDAVLQTPRRMRPALPAVLPVPQRRERAPRPVRYKFMDICSGSANVSAAARRFFDVIALLDMGAAECNTGRANFPRPTEIIMQDLFKWINAQTIDGSMVADIMHVSLPCPYWSPCHTVQGKNDEANRAILMCVDALVKRAKPRLLSFEQTTGLIQLSAHRPYWNKFVHMLTSEGYDVASKIINCAEYGNAHKRRRLMIYAAAPGEVLPKWPEPTHGDGPGLKPFVTASEAIARIPPGTLHHNPAELERAFQQKPGLRRWEVADADKPLHGLIMTRGAQVLHPNGRRQFTVREQMRLQQFSDSHVLVADSRSAELKMVGNAVPRGVMIAAFKNFKESLTQTDELVAARNYHRARSPTFG